MELSSISFSPGPVGLVTVLGGVIALTSIVAALTGVYNVLFHPLSTYPGPRLAAATRLWFAWHYAKGTLPFAIHRLHVKYGAVVRIAPNELSYIHPEGWNEIYGHRTGKPEMIKDPAFYSTVASGPEGIFRAPRDRHAYLRRQLSHGFSDRSMREQESVIRSYADLMIGQLARKGAKGTENIADFTHWYNYFTFDVMSELVLGQPFNCLETSTYHAWPKMIFDNIRLAALLRCAHYWPWLSPVTQYLIPESTRRRRIQQKQLTAQQAAIRRNQKSERQDLVAKLVKSNSDVTDAEFLATVEALVIAGSETTASAMSGTTFHLLKNPDKLEKLTREVRSQFDSADDISFVSLNRLPYLLACLTEGLRVYPPAADAFPRNTGSNVEIIMGQPVPPNTIIRMTHWATYYSPENFSRPNEYIPERWLENETGFANDRKDALQPFHVGPRNCLGRNLAYMEMRLAVALVLWHFDLELCPASETWDRQRAFTLWEKPELLVKLKPRKV
ncbi:cytochrome P450 [Aspergillus avenaceus]|uniref:Cytochrome P450 n=1 Tax=Aspergillus avenaceus TaxID=36643 RepID=A0A5N6U1U7_ASPAV|nr:cytochrome P450 [Aspergillus avenaceus]